MLGWHITICKLKDGGKSPATPGAEEGKKLAVWQTDLGGLEWIDDLVKEGKAINLDGDGYPYWYTAQVKHLIAKIFPHPFGAHDPWVCGPYDIITDQWEGKTTVDSATIKDCNPDEWLKVEVWDES